MSKEEGKEAGGKEESKPQEYLSINSHSEIGQMRKGDYMIHVYVEIARQLKVPEGQTVDPMIEIQCMGEKKYTTAKDDIGATGVVNWSEHLFFEPRGVSVDQIEQAKISIRCMDKGMFKDALIGQYEFDVAYIYFMNKEHLLNHKWIALSNPGSENFNEVTGYLKLSISVAATGDEQIQITDDTENADDSVMMPPQIKPEYYQLFFRFYQAQKLPIMDKGFVGIGAGSIDAYITCEYMNQKLRTKTYTMKSETVLWFQEFCIPVSLPIMSSRLVMKLWDEDKIKDEIVGSIIFNLKDYIDQKSDQPFSRFFWKNVYGAPLDRSGANTDLMNSNPELASTWKGRICMQVLSMKTEKPLISKLDMDELTMDLCKPWMQPHEYEIIAEVGQGIALPDKKKYTVKIALADFELKTPAPQVNENNYNRWNHRFAKTTWTTVYQDIFDVGKLYIYLMDGDNAVCYAKSNIQDWLDPDAKMKWIEMTPDLSIGKVTEYHKAGYISVKISIHDKTLNGPIDFQKFQSWKKPPPKRPNSYKIRCYIFQCRDLPAADADGQSDPYIEVWDSKGPKQTKYIEDNVNPLFYETVEISYESHSEEDLPPFIFDVYDKDFVPLDPDDFIGRAIIYRADANVSHDDTVPKPKWHPCRIKQGAPECGEVLVSFSIVDDDHTFKTDLKYMNLMETVRFDDYNVEITILGLRALQSVGILPVKKAFIQFNLKSLVPPTCTQAIENIKTQPGPAGPDPTINTQIQFMIPLPGDPLYCPRLQCSVYDNIFKGYLQPLLGVFTIPIGDILFRRQREKFEEMEGLDSIIKELDAIMQDQGVVTYNIQETPLEVEDDTFRSMATKQKEVINKSIKFVKEEKKEVKEVKEMLYKPLLLISEDDDDEDKPKSRKSSVASKHSSKHSSRNATPKGNKAEFLKSQFKSEEEKFDSRSIHNTPRTPRLTPKDFLPQVEKPKKGGGILSSPLTFFNKLTGYNKAEEMKKRKDEEERIKREEQIRKERELEEWKRKAGANPHKNIVRPSYYYDELIMVYRETNIPPPSMFIGLGYDDVPEDKRRHYRRYYPDELENIRELIPRPSPFDSYELKRGQTRGASKSWFSFSKQKEDDSGQADTVQTVGKFKCIINIESDIEKKVHEEEKEQKLHDLKTKLNSISIKKTGKPVDFNLEKLDSVEGRNKFKLQMEKMGVGHLDITKFLANLQAEATLRRLLLNKNECIVRLYMINAYDLASRDIGSASDPYLYLTLGKKIYNERDNYIQDEPNPDFFKVYDFDANFPGCPMLSIQCYDFDDLFGDDLIGETKIDLEDRFFSLDWQQLRDKPIEYRQLYHPSSSISQGVVKCWVEIMPSNNPMEQFDIRERPAEEFEIRVVVFDTVDIKAMDSEGTSDVYIRGFFDSREQAKETDTHYRCSDGAASFNYRFLFDSKYPRQKKDYSLTIQAYDRDFFKSNDIIGEARIDLSQAFEDVALTKKPISVTKKYYEKLMMKKGGQTIEFNNNGKDENTFWLQLTGMGEKGGIENTGKVRVQIDILPKDYAKQNMVGEARQEPNINPYLPPPIGRISFTMNPFKMLVNIHTLLIFQNQLVGPAMRRKIYAFACCALCIAIFVMCAPIIMSNLFTKLLMLPFEWMFGTGGGE